MEKEEAASPPGILRVDTAKSRIVVQPPGEPSSPQPSVDRLSVSFAPEYERSSVSDNEFPAQDAPELASDVSVRVNVFRMNGSPVPGVGGEVPPISPPDEDDDYSTSMTAILHRRASQRKVRTGKRRTSSPLDSDRRRSSVFTTSSGDTAITMEGEGTTQEQIFENIRLHKELLEHVKQQPWEMRRKMKLIQQAKEYVKVHEGELQERLAQSRNTKDIMARFKLLLMRYWQQLKRELMNLAANMIPWEMRIKNIESHFGSVVASYFTFLRWLFWVNIVTSAILICFVIVPEELVIQDKSTAAYHRKILLESEEKTATYLQTLWEFEGRLKHSWMFYGYYADNSGKYKLPLTYFITGLAVYVYSFVAILRKMAKNSRQSKLSEKEDECAFSWKLFTAWDFMIGNPETAFNRFASITMGFKEALLEEKERTKDERNWKVISLRAFANFLILLLLISSAVAVVWVVDKSAKESSDADSYEITLVLSLIGVTFPSLFEFIGMLENHHPRKQLRWQLARIMVLNFLNLFTLIFALFGKVDKMTKKLLALRPTTTISPTILATPCANVSVNCTILQEYASFEQHNRNIANLTVLANFTTLSEIATSGIWNSTYSLIPSTRFNTTDWWNILNTFLKSSNFSQLQVPGNITEYTSETWSEFIDNENYTFWTNESNLDLNDTALWTPENRTVLISVFPMVLKLLGAYLATIVPTLTKTTPFVGDMTTSEASNITIMPPLSSTLYANISTTTEILETIETTIVSSDVPGSSKKPKRGRKRKRKHKRRRIMKDSSPSSSSTTTDSPDYTLPDNPYLGLFENTGSTNTDPWITESEEYDYDDDDSFNLIIGGHTNGYSPKSSTRGDIPVTTTTELPTTTEMVTIPPNVEKFLTNIMTIVTMMFYHNSTKSDVIDFSRVKEFSKWISTLESVTETRKTGLSDWNSTLGITVRVNFDEKETRNCFVEVCDDGSTSPPNLKEFLNCTYDDYFCTMRKLMGPRHDNCWIPGSSHCITTSTPSPTTSPNVSIELRKLCWETMFGQELVKLTVMDLIVTLGFTAVMDFIRAILVRVLNPCCCWDLEKQFPQYGDFKIAENILHLVNNQGMIWMGMFFSPALPALNLIKLVVLMYIRSWVVMTCNVPHETVFRASRSNNFYFALLLFMLFLCTLPVAYAIVQLEPSWHCGPFSQYSRIYHILTKTISDAVSPEVNKVLDYIASPGIVIPLLVLLVLIIYYLLSLTGALRETNNDLKIQLRRERTEERRKMFKMAGTKKDDTPMGKWQALMPIITPKTDGKQKRTSILTTGKMTGFAGAAKRAALKARQMQAAAVAAAAAEDEGNATDVDQASLPEDTGAARRISKGTAVGGATRKPSCTDSVASTRSEIPVIKISEETDETKSPKKSGVPVEKRKRVLKALIKAGKEQVDEGSENEKSISEKDGHPSGSSP